MELNYRQIHTSLKNLDLILHIYVKLFWNLYFKGLYFHFSSLLDILVFLLSSTLLVIWPLEGMTESCSSLTFMTLYNPTTETPSQLLFQTSSKVKSASVNQPQGVCVGKPAPHIELKVCTDGSFQIGRILTRGPHVMLRYWDQNPSTTLNHTNEVWLDTGDIGYIDDSGNLWLIGRTNNRIKSGGENVHPEEVSDIYTYTTLPLNFIFMKN